MSAHGPFADTSTSSSRVMAIAHCRDLLGHEANTMTDADVEAVRRHADAMARLIVDLFLKKAA